MHVIFAHLSRVFICTCRKAAHSLYVAGETLYFDNSAMLSPVQALNAFESSILATDEPQLRRSVSPNILPTSASSVQLAGHKGLPTNAETGRVYDFTGRLCHIPDFRTLH